MCEVVLTDVRYYLDTLILEDCSIGDEAAEHLGNTLKENDNLKVLDLSNNGITWKGCRDLVKDLRDCMLRVLLLHWNPIGPKGGQFIAKALVENEYLEILDVSNCHIGRAEVEGIPWPEEFAKREAVAGWRPKRNGESATLEMILTKAEKAERARKKKEAARKKEEERLAHLRLPVRKQHFEVDLGPAEDWQQMFLKNKHLIHIDISHNHFDSYEVETFRMGLDENHTIMGIHAAGNECFTDAMGFVTQYDHDG